MFRFRLVDVDGNDLGPFVSSEPGRHPGGHVPLDAGDILEVVRLVDVDESDDVAGYLIVKPI